MAPKRRAVKSESEDDTPLTMRKKPKKKKIKKGNCDMQTFPVY